MKQTLSIPLDEAVIQRAQLIAAYHSMTLQQLLSEALSRLVEQLAAEDYEQAKQRAFAQMEAGFHLGGMPFQREECYEH